MDDDDELRASSRTEFSYIGNPKSVFTSPLKVDGLKTLLNSFGEDLSGKIGGFTRYEVFTAREIVRTDISVPLCTGT